MGVLVMDIVWRFWNALRRALGESPAGREDFGATAQYAGELHDMGEMEALRSEVARDNDLDPLSPLHEEILAEAVALRLSVAERLRHFSARWEREVAPLVRRMGNVTVGIVAGSEALTAVTFDDVRRQAHIYALPAA